MSYLLLSRGSRVGTIGDRGDWLTGGIAVPIRAASGVAGGQPVTVFDSDFVVPAGAEAAGPDAWFTTLPPDFSAGGGDWYRQLLETYTLIRQPDDAAVPLFAEAIATPAYFKLSLPDEAWGAIGNVEFAIDDPTTLRIAAFRNIPDVRVKLGSADFAGATEPKLVIENVQRGQVDASDFDGILTLNVSFATAGAAGQNSLQFVGSPQRDIVQVQPGDVPAPLVTDGRFSTLFATLGDGDDIVSTSGTQTALMVEGGAGRDMFGLGSGDTRLRYREGDGRDFVLHREGGHLVLEVDASLRAAASIEWTWWQGNGTLSFADGGSIQVYGGIADIVWVDADGSTTDEPRQFQSDRMLGDIGADWLNGGGGSNWIGGGDGPDTLLGGRNNDTLRGDGGIDSLRGGGEDDLALGGDGADVLQGGGGNDELYGDFTDWRAQAGGDDDTMFGGTGGDVLVGGGGDDELSGGAINDELHGGFGGDRLFGESGDDDLFGDEGHDTLAGGVGADSMDAGTGDNRLAGGAGDDTLLAAEGSDRLRGGRGADTLIFSFGAIGRDVVLGYDRAAGDTVLFRYFPEFSGDGVTDFDDFAASLASVRARDGDLILNFTASGRIVFRDVVPAGMTVGIADLPDFLDLMLA